MVPKDRAIDSPKLLNVASRSLGVAEMGLGGGLFEAGDYLDNNLNSTFNTHLPTIKSDLVFNLPEAMHNIVTNTSVADGVSSAIVFGIAAVGAFFLAREVSYAFRRGEIL